MKRKPISVLIFVLFSINVFALSNTEIAVKKSRELIKKEKYSEALILLNKGIKEAKDSKIKNDLADLLDEKFRLLKKKKDFNEAIQVIEELEKLYKSKGYWHCFNAMNLCLQLGNKDQAFYWLEKMAGRGFPLYNFDGDEYKLLHGDVRLGKAVKEIKSEIGIGKPAKDFTVMLMTGEKLKISELKGKVVMLDFWNTKCTPCIKEMPFLKKMYKELNKKGFEIIGISFDHNKKKLENYLVKAELPWKLVFSGKGWGDPTGKLYGVTFNPATFLIDRNGKLRHCNLRGEELKKAVLELL